MPKRKSVDCVANPPPRMTADEKRLARSWHFDEKLPPARVAERLGRSLSSITRLFAQTKAPKPVGRPKALSEKQVDALVRLLEKMVDEADADYELTLDMVMSRGRMAGKACKRVVQDALHARGYYFRDLRHKPILTPEDIKERFAWAKKYRGKNAQWWRSNVHIHLDNHCFKVATTARGRKLMAKRRVRGVYRRRGLSLRSGHVKPNPRLRDSTGVRGFLKTGGVGGGKVLVWHTIPGSWSGAAAEQVYTDVVAPALQKRYPHRSSFTILEDNDPTGNMSRRGVKAKKTAKLKVLHIPKRSPELNVLDFAVWSEVERRMRKQEKSWPSSKKETRSDFGRRLDQTARRLPSAFIDRSVGDLSRRCKLLYEAKGALFEEGKRTRRSL